MHAATYRYTTCAALWSLVAVSASAQTVDTPFGSSRPEQLALVDARLHGAPAATTPAGSTAYVEPLLSFEYARLVVKDTGHVLAAPLHWDGADWETFGLWSGAIVLTSVTLDHTLRAAVQRSDTPGLDHALKDIEPFGQKRYTFPVLAGFYAYGQFADDPNARATTQDGIAASFVASGIVTPFFKGLVGRARPRQNEGAGHFHPTGGDTSFPSGHATEAFTIATVIAEHYPTPWVQGLTYGIASLVGIARIDHNAHFASDVLAGALVGHYVGQSIVRYNAGQRAEHSAWQPEIEAGAGGVSLAWRF